MLTTSTEHKSVYQMSQTRNAFFQKEGKRAAALYLGVR